MQPIRRQQLIDATLAAVNEVECMTPPSRRSRAAGRRFQRHHQPLFQDKNGLLEATMRYLISHLGEAVKLRLQALTDNSPAARQAIVAGNFDDSQINSAAMKTWLCLLGQQPAPAAAQPAATGERPPLYSNLCAEFRRVMPQPQARLAAKGLAH